MPACVKSARKCDFKFRLQKIQTLGNKVPNILDQWTNLFTGKPAAYLYIPYFSSLPLYRLKSL